MADIVTQLQDQVNQINGLFFNCAGVLQRDARPAGTVNGELSDALPEGGIDEKQIQEMAASVVAASRNVDALASSLPEVDLNKSAQLARIAALQAENDEVEKELEEELQKAEVALARVTAAFEATTDKILLSPEKPAPTA